MDFIHRLMSSCINLFWLYTGDSNSDWIIIELLEAETDLLFQGLYEATPAFSASHDSNANLPPLHSATPLYAFHSAAPPSLTSCKVKRRERSGRYWQRSAQDGDIWAQERVFYKVFDISRTRHARGGGGVACGWGEGYISKLVGWDDLPEINLWQDMHGWPYDYWTADEVWFLKLLLADDHKDDLSPELWEHFK